MTKPPWPGTPADIGFGNPLVGADAPVLVDDALADPRLTSSPFVQGHPRARSYFGVPVHAHGEAFGALCFLDHRELEERFNRLLDDYLPWIETRAMETGDVRALVADLSAVWQIAYDIGVMAKPPSAE